MMGWLDMSFLVFNCVCVVAVDFSFLICCIIYLVARKMDDLVVKYCENVLDLLLLEFVSFLWYFCCNPTNPTVTNQSNRPARTVCINGWLTDGLFVKLIPRMDNRFTPNPIHAHSIDNIILIRNNYSLF